MYPKHNERTNEEQTNKTNALGNQKVWLSANFSKFFKP